MMFRIFATFVAVLSCTSAAHAYLDPGTGSFVLQMALASLLAAGASIKIFWYRIKTFFEKIFGRRAAESKTDQ